MPFLTAILDVGKPDHMRVGWALRIVTFELARRVDPSQLQRRDAFGDISIDLAAQIDERAIVVGKSAFQLTHIHLQQTRQRVQLLLPASTSSGIAQTARAGTDDASTTPLRSVMRPRVAGISSVRAYRASPWRCRKPVDTPPIK
jgi:hypothetical protein